MNQPNPPSATVDAHSVLAAIRQGTGFPVGEVHPLYAYRCTGADVAALRAVLRDAAEAGPDGRFSNAAAECFCLYAAEWWRREYTGGPWKWEPIFASLGLGTPARSELESMIERGLRGWGRPLLLVGNRTGYLITLACEGGLPLSLLEKEGAHLRRYFRALLRDVHVFGDTSPVEIAERNSALLPKSYRQSSVYELSAQLVQSIWRLQLVVGPAADPIAALDARESAWRMSVPLNTSDAVATALLRGLLDDAVAVQREPRPMISVRTLLTREGHSWKVSREIVLPPIARTLDMAACLDVSWETLPRRFELCFQRMDGTEVPVALVTRSSDGETGSLRIEATGERLRCTAEAALPAMRIIASRKGRSFAAATVAGGGPLTEVPWIFINSGSEGASALRLTGQGRLSLRSEEAVVVLPDDSMVLEGETLPLGLVEGVRRRVVRVHGTVTIEVGGDGRYVISTAQSEDDALEYNLRGKRLPLCRASADVWLGLPTLIETRTAGVRVAVSRSDLSWRPRGLNASWRSISDVAPPDSGADQRCVGDVEVRYAPGGNERFRARWTVLPAEAEVDVTPSGRGRGEIVCRRLGPCDLGAMPRPDEWQRGVAGETTLLFQHSDPIPEHVTLELDFGGGRRTRFDVPYPSRDVRFLGRDGLVLDPDAIVWVEQLVGVRAQVVDATSGGQFYVEGTLRADDSAQTKPLVVTEELIEIAPARYELDLRMMADTLRVLLGASSKLDATVRLTIDSRSGQALPRRNLTVARYDATLRPNLPDIRLDAIDLARLGRSVDSLRLEARPVSDPGAEPRLAESVEPGHWRFDPPPDVHEPWMITAWEGNLCRVRPLRVRGADARIDAPPAPAAGAAKRIADIVRVVNVPARLDGFRALLARIGRNADDPAWTELDGYLGTLGSLPATTFDVVQLFIEDADTLALGLLRASTPVELETIWRGLETLPFLVALVPVHAWIRAAMRWQASIRRACALASLESAAHLNAAVETFLRNAPRMSPVFAVIADALAFALTDMPEPTDRPLLRAGNPGAQRQVHDRIASAKQDLLRAHVDAGGGPDPWWPTAYLSRDAIFAAIGSGVPQAFLPSDEGFPHRRDVLAAPLLAACVTVFESIRLSSAQRFEFIKMRAFEPAWFDDAHAAFVSLLLAAEIQKKASYLDVARD